ncbi:MAG TPA: hypothetical protein VMM35_02805, partial [Longimicrobiales bacterium]|nr:hypothetical protein [Longimicrobiales bacterium]
AVAVGACMLGASGCSAVRSVADGLSEEGPPGTTRAPDSPLAGQSSSSGVSGASVGDAIRTVKEGDRPATGAASSAYVVSPALTWGALQLHRPYAITGSLFTPRLESGPECRAEGWAPFEITAQPNRLFAEEVVRNEHVPFGIRSSFMPIGSVLSLDRDVVADHVMRSGAYLVQRGPVCFESLFISAYWVIGEHTRGSGAEAYW